MYVKNENSFSSLFPNNKFLYNDSWNKHYVFLDSYYVIFWMEKERERNISFRTIYLFNFLSQWTFFFFFIRQQRRETKDWIESR